MDEVHQAGARRAVCHDVSHALAVARRGARISLDGALGDERGGRLAWAAVVAKLDLAFVSERLPIKLAVGYDLCGRGGCGSLDIG